MARVLNETEIRNAIASDLDGWRYADGRLETDYKFPNFERVIAFMVECAPAISREDHHPEWTNVFNRLHVVYRTHDAGNQVTEKDIAMARKLEEIYSSGYQPDDL